MAAGPTGTPPDVLTGPQRASAPPWPRRGDEVTAQWARRALGPTRTRCRSALVGSGAPPRFGAVVRSPCSVRLNPAHGAHLSTSATPRRDQSPAPTADSVRRRAVLGRPALAGVPCPRPALMPHGSGPGCRARSGTASASSSHALIRPGRSTVRSWTRLRLRRLARCRFSESRSRLWLAPGRLNGWRRRGARPGRRALRGRSRCFHRPCVHRRRW